MAYVNASLPADNFPLEREDQEFVIEARKAIKNLQSGPGEVEVLSRMLSDSVQEMTASMDPKEMCMTEEEGERLDEASKRGVVWLLEKKLGLRE